ncbi:MAG: secretin N-terminal domain-containing protein [Candidatus Omnitrophota bacterium]
MKKMLIASIILIVFVFCSAGLSYAQDNDSQIVDFLEFRDVDIKDILRQLAKQYNLNIVFSESVSGLATVQLAEVTVQQALDSIITVNGFAYTKKDNVYKITTPEEAEREGKMTKLFRLKNADATELKQTLKNSLSSDGTIEADVRSNSIIVTDMPRVVNRIQSMLSDLDSTTPQILIEAKLIETSLTNTEKLGIDWSTTITATGAARKTTLPFQPGGDEGWTKNVFPPAATTDANFSSTRPYSFPYTAKADFTFGTLDFTALQLTFDFLRSRSDTKLIANPRIVTLNNQKATINVGKAIPIATYERNENTGRWEITGWEEEKEMVGVNLTVTPQVSPDNRIRLKLKPEVSSIFDWITDEDANKQRPITTTRVAETEVQIKDGQTVVIGGLIKDKTLIITKKVPILGDIPLLGLLFRRKEVSSAEDPNEQTDLLIFVTATIIKETDKPLIGWEHNLITAAQRPFKLEMRADIKK